MIVDLNEDSASVEIVSKSTESGFASEESELISSSSDLDKWSLVEFNGK